MQNLNKTEQELCIIKIKHVISAQTHALFITNTTTV